MKFFINKETSKKIIIAILLVMSFNFISPTISQANAVDTFGGLLFEPISMLLRTVGDLVLGGLQDYFMGTDDIKSLGGALGINDPKNVSDSVYRIKYSPGIIFSGNVPGLKVNFINAKEEDGTTFEKVDNYESVGTMKPDDVTWDINNRAETVYYYNDSTEADFVADSKRVELIMYTVKTDEVFKAEGNGDSDHIQGDGGVTYILRRERVDWVKTNDAWSSPFGFERFHALADGVADLASIIAGDKFERFKVEQSNIYKDSAAYLLQDTVATWYKALRAIALVGLLSVLVYIGIRILISSTGQEKAKYKKMIGDWLAAICILFVLQYIMVFTLEITQKVTAVLSKSVVGSEGQDILMSDLRNKLGDGSDFSEIFPETIMYVVLVIYTCVFTFQYLKRLLYMAFFTMIAPLIALTYPLDKIKDGQAQAFTTWIREYIFNALLQPMHLLLYYMFVSSANELVESNPVYAIVAIGFLIPAEKFFRKMFGFNKSETASQVGAAAGGALIMNAISKMGQKSGKQAAGKSGGANDSGGSSGGSTPKYISGPGGSSNGGNGGGPSNPPRDVNGDPIGNAGQAFGQDVKGAQYGGSNTGNGLRTLRGHYFNRGNFGKNGKVWKAVGRGIRKGAVGAVGAATLGTVGLAAGIATGDVGNALKYGAAGAGAGYMGANYVGDKATELEKKNREIFKEGALGTDEYNTRNSIKELTNDNDFNRVCKELGVTDQKGREALIRQFHSNGITKSEDIKKAINAGASIPNTNRNQIITAAKIKQEAQRYGHKKKEIEQGLISNGVPAGSDEFKKAMQLIDLL